MTSFSSVILKDNFISKIWERFLPYYYKTKEEEKHFLLSYIQSRLNELIHSHFDIYRDIHFLFQFAVCVIQQLQSKLNLPAYLKEKKNNKS